MKRLVNKIIAIVWWLCTLSQHYDVERRNSVKYKKKKRIVKNVWIGVGITTLLVFVYFPGIVGIMFTAVVVLTTTCVAFIILDETP